MSTEFVYVALLLGVLLVLAVPTGRYIAKVFSGENTLLTPLLRPLEKRFYSLLGIDENKEMSWKTYASALIAFNILSVIAVFLLQEAQGWFPLNPQGFGSVRWDTAVNTAISFTTNTNRPTAASRQ